MAGVTGWATAEQVSVDKLVTEVGWALTGHRGKFLALWRDVSVGRIVVEHRDRFCGLGSEYVEAALTGICARRYGKRAAAHRAQRALAAAADAGESKAP